LGIRNRAEWRPPELRLESLLVNLVHHCFDVGIAAWKLLRIELPIAIIVLPTVVQGDPGKSHALNCGQCVIDLLRLEVASVSPRAPDRSESTFWGFGHLEPLFQHEAAVRKQRLEIVSVMHGNERAKGVEVFAGLQILLVSILHTDLSLTCVEHGNW